MQNNLKLSSKECIIILRTVCFYGYPQWQKSVEIINKVFSLSKYSENIFPYKLLLYSSKFPTKIGIMEMF